MTTTTDDVDEHPIIFNEWSIRRILTGEKTQTRRLTGLDGVNEWPDVWSVGSFDGSCSFRLESEHDVREVVMSPYGAPGDVLWCREAFRFDKAFDDASPTEIVRDVPRDRRLRRGDVQYEATPEDGPFTEETQGRLRPSIHMPKEMCRLRLRVEDVRVERVQEISERDVLAEGLQYTEGYGWNATDHDSIWWERHDGAFSALWNDIHGDGAWEENPWIWVIEFSRIESK